MQDQNYREIDLIDLLFNILLNIKKIIILALVGAVLGCSLALYKDNKEDKVVDALLLDSKQALKDYKDDISQSDLLAVNMYQNSLIEADRQEDYLKYAPKLSNTVNDYVYQYSANLKLTNVTDVNGIINFIQNEVFNDETLSEITDEIGLKTDSKYYSTKYFLKELFSLRNISESDTVVGDITASRIKTLNFSFTASSEEMASKVGEKMINTILSYKDEIASEFNSNIYLINSVTNSRYSPEINSLKIDLQTKLSALIEGNKDIQKSFSRIQLKYLSSINPDLDIEVGKGLTKSTLLGFLMGGFVICIYYVMIYVLADKLHSAYDINDKDLKVYGTLNTKSNITWLDKLFKKDDGESLKTIINKIKLDLSNNEVKELVISTTLSDATDLSELLDGVKKELSIDDIYLDVTNNENFFEKCKEGASVIYVEKIGSSKNKDINKVIYNDKELKIKSLGVIVVD